MGIHQPKEVLNKAYRQVKIAEKDFDNFISYYKDLLDNINDSQTEETQKKHLMYFLGNSFYNKYYYAPEGDIDFAIHLDKKESSNVGLLLEVKSTTNRNEMISNDNLNKKAFQELLLYYLRERVLKKNFELKYLIVTNIYEYFIFDAQEFERVFFHNKNLIKEFEDFANGRLTDTKTNFFYNTIAPKYIDEIKKSIEYTYFDIRDYKKSLDKDNRSTNLIELYKVFSDTNLLKLPFQNDSNSLNNNFYTELLHIIGLEETIVDNKKLILRKKEGKQDDASIIENAINILDSEDRLSGVSNISNFGINHKEQLFNIAMELCITWINRILFLKLLEAQLIKYQKGNLEYKFLTPQKIKDYDVLNKLFFQVLAKSYDERNSNVIKDFINVPYLNSSLFELSRLERETICISNLESDLQLSLISSTILKDKNNKLLYKKLPTLQYLLDFLDAYDFASEGSEGIQKKSKTLINASVLGLIFEKINGHKDGSVFTPGFITMYMSKTAIQKTVINKFNKYYNWDCKSIIDLYNKIDDIQTANKIINDIKICDPAVGSGHFLVSALNEIIRIKYELAILVDINGGRIKKQDYTFTIENDELIITDENNNLFSYNPQNTESRRIQETIFKEKRQIIENCLFGVDINHNSAKICRLRLWIELLKNAYYTKESNYTYLETLPNIDINIKSGNSLLSRFDLDTDIKDILKTAKINISDYRNAVKDYKDAPNKEKKNELSDLISKIKSTLKTEISKNNKLVKDIAKLRGYITNLESPKLFETPKEKKAREKSIEVLNKKFEKKTSELEEIQSNRIFKNAFEWRIEFPEILNEDGDFMGFDCIIGNPPYIQLQANKGELANLYQDRGYSTFDRSGDIYSLFYENGINLLKENGTEIFITSNKWMRAGYGKSTRNYFLKYNPIKIIDLGSKVFETATVDTNILIIEKSENKNNLQAVALKDRNKDINNLDFMPIKVNSNEIWTLLTPIEYSIKQKIESVGTPLKDWDINIYRGILTGYNEAFIINGEKKNELIEKDPKSAEIIKPILRGRDIKRYNYDFADLWLIATFPSLHIDIEQYPAIKNHLLSFGIERIEQTGKEYYINGEKIKARKKTNNKWFEIQDSIGYWDEFSKQKIAWA